MDAEKKRLLDAYCQSLGELNKVIDQTDVGNKLNILNLLLWASIKQEDISAAVARFAELTNAAKDPKTTPDWLKHSLLSAGRQLGQLFDGEEGGGS